MTQLLKLIIIIGLCLPVLCFAEECKYTTSEIDALRYVVEEHYLFGTTVHTDNSMSRTYREETMSKVVEERVRTYMQGCIKAEDIISSDIEKKVDNE